MNETDAKRIILEHAIVPTQRVILAKSIVLSACKGTSSSDDLVDAVLKANSLTAPTQVVLDGDCVPALNAAGYAMSWSLAAREAIWSLIHAGFLIPFEGQNDRVQYIEWKAGNHSSGWQFHDQMLPVPDRVRRTPSSLGSNNQFLAEPDLYLNALDVPNMHPDVASAFQEAVRCFRSELFTAALSMLGKASEGAWLELGASLLKCVPIDQRPAFDKQRAVLEDPMTGTNRKIEAVLAMFDRKDVFNAISQSSGIKPKELRLAAAWSDTVRDSRNTIHFGVSPATPNTYEKIAVLLLGAAPNIRVLYRLKEAADAAAIA